MPDFLIVGQEDWDDVERRNQLLVLALARRHPSARFVFAELPLRARRLARARPLRLRRVADNVVCVRTLRPLPDRLPLLGRVNDRVEARRLRAALRRAGVDRPVLWTQDPRAATLVDLLPVERVVYDLTDDWVAFEADPARRAAVVRNVESLARRADLVLACSRALQEQTPRAIYVPNAVEPPGPPAPEPRDIAGLPRPRWIYSGTLHDARLDVELVAEAAALRPDASLVLLGPDHLSERSRRLLRSRPNVHLLGTRAHREVRGYLEHCDVCLVPHRVTDFTRSLDPLKLYEYLAAGRPVVATDAGIAAELAAEIAVVAGAEQLVAAAGAADDSAAARTRRRALVAGATWEARAAQVEELLGVEPEQAGPDVSAVVVSFDTRDLLERTLASLAAQTGPSVETIVVDNGSTDGSVELVRERFPRVRLVELGENAGFGRANNIAFRLARGRTVLLLNSDCFLAPGALAELVAALDRHPGADVAGPRLLNPDGSLQRSAWPFPSAPRLALEALLLHRPLRALGLVEDLGTWAHDEERAVEFLVGACLLVRREALEAVGGFDEGFWLYGEEADLQRRLAARGRSVVLVPAAEAVHVGGASSRSSAVRLRHFYRGQKRFLRKHGGPGAWPVARAALLVGSVLRGRVQAAGVALDPRL